MDDELLAERLKGTLACDEFGRPLVLHHGTYATFDRFERTEDIGFHFGTIDQAQRRRREAKPTNEGDAWKIRSAALMVKKVFVLPDDPRTWKSWHTVRHIGEEIDPRMIYRMREQGYSNPVPAFRRLREIMLDVGYDALVYRNVWEAPAGKNLSWSWVALHADAVVELGSQPDRARLLQEVGDPSLRLPSSLRDIPGATNKSGTIRYRSEQMAFIDTVVERVGLRPLEEIRLDAWVKFEMELGGRTLGLEICPYLGRVRIKPDDDLWAHFGDLLDDSSGTHGMLRSVLELRTQMHFHSISVDWRPGEHLEAFTERLARKLEEIASLMPVPVTMPA